MTLEVRYHAIFKFLFTSNLDTCLKAHNVLRNLHSNTGPLQWDAKLAADSKIWAEHLVSIDEMKHSYRGNEGENIYYSKSKSVGSCVDAALAW